MDEPDVLLDLLPDGWRTRAFRPFRQGVEISMIRTGNPSVALLRYAPGASIPYHEHTGLETILVLEGAQSDERGRYPAGSLILNRPGTAHSIWSDEGCTVLIQWEKPVKFISAGSAET